MNGDGYPLVPRRRAVAISLDRDIGWAGHVTEFLALFFAAVTLVGALRLIIGVGYGPFGLQEAATLILAALPFPIVYLLAEMVAPTGAVAGPDAYLGEDRRLRRDEGDGDARG